MNEKFYGKFEQTKLTDDISGLIEQINVQGFCVILNLISEPELVLWRQKIDSIYLQQEHEFGASNLEAIQELNNCRAPLLYDFSFSELVTQPIVLKIVEHFLSDFFILNLQNAVINLPNQTHHQSTWHRDIPYLNRISTTPLALNAFYTIDPFSVETGGTTVVPYSHKLQVLPSDDFIKNNSLTVHTPAGTVIIFDSMLLHRAGYNSSNQIRRGINHLYTIPLLKQQYDFPKALSNNKNIEPKLKKILGYGSEVPLDVQEFREARLKHARNIPK